MLKRIKETFTGAPNLADAQRAAEQRRKDLIGARHAVEQTEAALDAAHDQNLEDKKILAAEAALADSRLAADRAARAYKAAEQRLHLAKRAEDERGKQAIRTSLEASLKARAAAARRIDSAAKEIAEARAELDRHDQVLAEAIKAHVAPGDARPAIGRATRLVEIALNKTGVFPQAWIGDRAQIPTAASIVDSDNELLAGERAPLEPAHAH